MGNCMPMFSMVGKKGPHSILGGFATAFNIISRILQSHYEFMIPR